MIFVSAQVNYGAWHVYKPLFGFTFATCQLACSEVSLSIKEKKQPEGGPESALTLYKWLADGVTALAQLRVCALMWKICFFRRNNTYLLISGWFNRFIPKVRHFRNLSVWELSQKSNELVGKYAKQNVRVEKINQFGYNLTEILHMKILISTWVAMSK